MASTSSPGVIRPVAADPAIGAGHGPPPLSRDEQTSARAAPILHLAEPSDEAKAEVARALARVLARQILGELREGR
jgi:hypothetical protein